MTQKDASLAILKDFTLMEPDDRTAALPMEEVDKMLDLQYAGLEHGYINNEDGTWFVACRTVFPKACTGEMFDFWLSHCDDTERYQWWHPIDHKKGTWDDEYFQTSPELRPRDHYLGHRHKVVEDVGQVEQHLQIEWMSPMEFGFSSDYITKFEKAHVTACACANVYAYDFPFGYLQAGALVHMVCLQEDGTSILRSRFWLGHVDAGSCCAAPLINRVGKTKWFRSLKVPEKVVKGLFVHCAEEMFILGRILPDFCAKEKEKHRHLREESKM